MFFDEQGNIPEDKLKYARELIGNYVSGRLKVAPEHTSDAVLEIMRKPSFSLFYKLKKLFDQVNREKGLNQQLIPYFISSHPGSKSEDMVNLALEMKSMNFQLEQVQDFTPTPMTVATEMYYSGVHPYTLKPGYTAKSKEDKLNQRQFFFWYKKEYQQQIRAELLRMGRKDLIDQLLGKSRK